MADLPHPPLSFSDLNLIDILFGKPNDGARDELWPGSGQLIKYSILTGMPVTISGLHLLLLGLINHMDINTSLLNSITLPVCICLRHHDYVHGLLLLAFSYPPPPPLHYHNLLRHCRRGIFETSTPPQNSPHRHNHSRLSNLHSRHSLRSPVISGASTGSGQYFVALHLGSPPQPLLLVADTGSDLIWVACSACRDCSIRPPGSAFLARHSASFSPHHCFHPTCLRLVPPPTPNPCNHSLLHSPCRYEYQYSDGSLTAGFFAEEIVTLNTSSGQQVELRDFHFGCGFRNTGPSIAGGSFNGAHGVMGLGRGPISFSSQLGRRFGNKFSYCLMDYTLSPPPTSFLVIGGRQHDAASKLSFTPLLLNPLSPTFYYIAIKSIYIDNIKLPINPSVWSIDEMGNGGTVIDSGTTLTFLAEPAYREILTAFKRRVKLPTAADQAVLGFDLCVNVSGVSRPRFPQLSFELVGDSVFEPPQRNYFIETSERVECLAIQPVSSESGFSVIGNLMQQGFLFEFDRDHSRLGFSRHGCDLS